MTYFVREEIGLSSEWIFDHVVPHMCVARIPRQVCIVLGQTLLWNVWESSQGNGNHRVPLSILSWDM